MRTTQHQPLTFADGSLDITSECVQLSDHTGHRWIMDGPLKMQVLLEDQSTKWIHAAYESLAHETDRMAARGRLRTPRGSVIRVEDEWRVEGATLSLRRQCTVETAAPGDRGFMSAVELERTQPADIQDFRTFMPAFLYGDHAALPDDAVASLAHRRAGVTDFMVREDAMPAPVVALMEADGAALAMYHADPDGATNMADADDLTGHTLVDRVFAFGSMGLRQTDDRVRAGFWYPGTEGDAMRVMLDPMKRKWKPHNRRGRYHPVEEGFSHSYELRLAFGRHDDFPTLLNWAWRQVFETLNPQVVPQDLEAVESAIIQHLSDNIHLEPDGAIGVPFLVESVTGQIDDNFYGLGFCARNEAVAEHLLRIGHRDGNERFLEQGRNIIDFWTSRTGPGFSRVVYRPDEQRFGGQDWFIHQRANVEAPPEGEAVSLRELTEGHHGGLRAWRIEEAHGVHHPEWLKWCVDFGEWLIAQRDGHGLFPRWWTLDGQVLDPSNTGSFNAVPFLCELAQVTQDRAWLNAAEEVGRKLFDEGGHDRGLFIGGTIDNPDLLDKEAASISLEAYLALYRGTKKREWLAAARIAAAVTESWITLWDIPMPVDADPDALDWKPGATTVGLNMVAVGGGGGDEYLAFNAGEFAELYALTGDEHYKRVADILLHNTKVMLALPNRTYDLLGPGWQQEHWSMSLMRGRGHHRYWLPWVTVCHLTGMANASRANLYYA